MFKSIVTIASTCRIPRFTSQCTAIMALWSILGASQVCVAQVAAPEVPATVKHTATSHAGTARQQEYLNATLDQRIRLSERIGEDGARAFARSKGWEPIFDGTSKTIPQGLDQVYLGADGTIHVIEAKGGTGQLGHAYGHPQGSSEWAVEAAKRMLRSSKASAAEQTAAKAVLKAASQGRLSVHVVRTSHVLGEPTAAVLQQTVKCANAAAKAAQTALDDIARASAETVDDVARVVAKGSNATRSTLKTVANAAVVVGVVVDGGVRVRDGIETEYKFAAGEISVQQREISHTKNAARMAGGWGGANGGAWIAGSAVAPFAAMTGPAAPFVEGAAVAAGGIAGYIGGEAAAGKAAEMAINVVHSTGTTIGGAAGSAWSATSSAAQHTGKAARNAWWWATGW